MSVQLESCDPFDEHLPIAHLIVALDLLHEDGQVLDAQRRVVVHLPVGSLDARLRVTVTRDDTRSAHQHIYTHIPSQAFFMWKLVSTRMKKVIVTQIRILG